jgi:hypothetical protein
MGGVVGTLPSRARSMSAVKTATSRCRTWPARSTYAAPAKWNRTSPSILIYSITRSARACKREYDGPIRATRRSLDRIAQKLVPAVRFRGSKQAHGLHPPSAPFLARCRPIFRRQGPLARTATDCDYIGGQKNSGKCFRPIISTRMPVDPEAASDTLQWIEMDALQHSAIFSLVGGQG